jgi:hypothetical protein
MTSSRFALVLIEKLFPGLSHRIDSFSRNNLTISSYRRTTTFSLLGIIRVGRQSSPSPSHLPIDSVRSVYSLELSWIGGAEGREI